MIWYMLKSLLLTMMAPYSEWWSPADSHRKMLLLHVQVTQELVYYQQELLPTAPGIDITYTVVTRLTSAVSRDFIYRNTRRSARRTSCANLIDRYCTTHEGGLSDCGQP